MKEESENLYYHHRLLMALDDLLHCKKYCEMMLTLSIGKAFSQERTVYEALFISFIVSYGRVFTTSNTIDHKYKYEVSNKFGKVRSEAIKCQSDILQKLHERILEKRDTSIAHSDAVSRNYKHHSDTPLAIGEIPYYPFEHDEISISLKLITNLASILGAAITKSEKHTFKRTLFDIPERL